MPIPLRPLALCGLVALVACAPGAGTRVDPLIRQAPFQAGEIGRTGPFPLEVRGAPPDGSDAAAVAAQMRTPVSLGNRQMVVATPGAPGPRVVIAFAGADQTGLCDGRTSAARAAPTESSGRLAAALAFCRGNQTVTTTRMTSGATSGPRDDGFARTMRQTMAVLMPDETDTPRGSGR